MEADARGYEEPVRGARLGLPAEGPGSVASSGRRSLAFAVDAISCGLVARLLDPVQVEGQLDLSVGLLPVVVLVVVYLLGLLLAAQTPGMRLLGLRVARLDGARLDLRSAGLRTALLVPLVPALISDRDGRGLHDRAAGTVVLNVR
ncbi:MAG: domain containing protein [Frankiales bacterium]|nr:domain containing protein [Frankiales bacterium]